MLNSKIDMLQAKPKDNSTSVASTNLRIHNLSKSLTASSALNKVIEQVDNTFNMFTTLATDRKPQPSKLIILSPKTKQDNNIFKNRMTICTKHRPYKKKPRSRIRRLEHSSRRINQSPVQRNVSSLQEFPNRPSPTRNN